MLSQRERTKIGKPVLNVKVPKKTTRKIRKKKKRKRKRKSLTRIEDKILWGLDKSSNLVETFNNLLNKSGEKKQNPSKLKEDIKTAKSTEDTKSCKVKEEVKASKGKEDVKSWTRVVKQVVQQPVEAEVLLERPVSNRKVKKTRQLMINQNRKTIELKVKEKENHAEPASKSHRLIWIVHISVVKSLAPVRTCRWTDQNRDTMWWCLPVCCPLGCDQNRVDWWLLVKECIAKTANLRNPFLEKFKKFFGLMLWFSNTKTSILANQPTAHSGGVSMGNVCGYGCWANSVGVDDRWHVICETGDSFF